MASAGRILIMPKGDYNAETQYEMLDLVYHNGTSWLAKKTAVGIEPSEANKEYWQNMFDIDMSEIKSRLESLENQMVSEVTLDDIDLSGYAKNTVPANENSAVDPNVTPLPRVRTIHENCPTSDTGYVIDTIFVNDGENTYEKYQYARGFDDKIFTRYRRYDTDWTPWTPIVRGGSFQIQHNASELDYIDYTFEREAERTIKVFANTEGTDTIFVVGVSVTNYAGKNVSIRIKLSEPNSYPINISVGYLY